MKTRELLVQNRREEKRREYCVEIDVVVEGKGREEKRRGEEKRREEKRR